MSIDSRTQFFKTILMALATAGFLLELGYSQETIIDRPAFGTTDDDFSALAGEGNRFGNFDAFYPADHFRLNTTTIIDNIELYADVRDGFSFNGCLPGFTLHILRDNEGQPDGYPFDTAGEFGSDGVVYFDDLRPSSSLSNISPFPSVRVNFTSANGGEEVILPAGTYWLTVARRATCSTPQEQGHWRWRQSASSPEVAPLITRWSFGFSDWQPLEERTTYQGGTMAWKMTGTSIETILLGDVNMDGEINLLDVAPFVDLLA
ncbi:MAG: hypothetical protein AAGA30_20460, partial [Planctomycetota bacterium]